MTRRLRTRTGCLRCRKRRKKCDDVYPYCGPCSRLGLQCHWDRIVSGEDQSLSPSQRCYQISARTIDQSSRCDILLSNTLHLFGTCFANNTEYQLLQKWPACYSAVSLPYAQPDNLNLFMFITVGIQEDFVRTALVSFAGYVLFMKGEEYFPTSYILEIYQSSVKKLSRTLSADSCVQNYLGLLISATMLGALECSGIGNPHIATAHFSVAIYACSKFLQQQACDAIGRQTCRLAAELWLYGLPSLCFFVSQKELSQILEYLDESLLDVVFHPDQAIFELGTKISPCLGIPPRIILLLLKSVHLSKQRTLPSLRIVSRIHELWKTLYEVEASLDGFYGTGSPYDSGTQRNRDTSQIFLCAIAIYLIQMEECHPSIKLCRLQSEVDVFLKLLSKDRDVLVETSLLWWPLAVVLYVTKVHDIPIEFPASSASFHFDGGCRKRWDIFTEIISRQQHKHSNPEETNSVEPQRNTNMLLTAFDIRMTAEHQQRFDSFTRTSPGPENFWLWRKHGGRSR